VDFTELEMATILDDTTKEIRGDIRWAEDQDHSPSVEFRAEVVSESGYPLFVRGSYNPLAQALTFAMIHAGSRRIYALDLGKDHHNPGCRNVGERHKHRWSDLHRDKNAYVANDIGEPVSNPVGVWREFCAEAKVTHRGILHAPTPHQPRLFP
jgi:hypothetical protein